jgi:hypothetical protein
MTMAFDKVANNYAAAEAYIKPCIDGSVGGIAAIENALTGAGVPTADV